MIREANHCVYIENQFCELRSGSFLSVTRLTNQCTLKQRCSRVTRCIVNLTVSITTTATGQPVENLIGLAIAQRVISAAQEGRKFKVIVMIPAVP